VAFFHCNIVSNTLEISEGITTTGLTKRFNISLKNLKNGPKSDSGESLSGCSPTTKTSSLWEEGEQRCTTAEKEIKYEQAKPAAEKEEKQEQEVREIQLCQHQDERTSDIGRTLRCAASGRLRLKVRRQKYGTTCSSPIPIG